MKVKSLLFTAIGAAMLTSCAAVKSPLMATTYAKVKAPFAVTGNANSSKVGTATATSYLGIVALGDASIDAAAKSAGISKIHHVDEESTLILGIIAKYTVYVYGE